MEQKQIIGLSPCDFDQSWAELHTAVRQFLSPEPGKPRVSYEKTYCACYKSVCHGHSVALHDNLMRTVSGHLRNVAQQIVVCSGNDLQSLISNLCVAWNQYDNALQGIVPVFSYLNRFYVSQRLNSDLRSQLLDLFDSIVLRPHVKPIIEQVSLPDSALRLGPDLVQSVVRTIYAVNATCSSLNEELFRRYVAELVPKVSVNQLPDLCQEASRMLDSSEPNGNDTTCDDAMDCSSMQLNRGLKRSHTPEGERCGPGKAAHLSLQ